MVDENNLILRNSNISIVIIPLKSNLFFNPGVMTLCFSRCICCKEGILCFLLDLVYLFIRKMQKADSSSNMSKFRFES